MNALETIISLGKITTDKEKESISCVYNYYTAIIKNAENRQERERAFVSAIRPYYWRYVDPNYFDSKWSDTSALTMLKNLTEYLNKKMEMSK